MFTATVMSLQSCCCSLVYILLCLLIVIIENDLLYHYKNIENELIKGVLVLPSSMSMVYGAAFSCSCEACHPYSCDIFCEALLCLLKIAGRGEESNKARYCIKKVQRGKVIANKCLIPLPIFLIWLM